MATSEIAGPYRFDFNPPLAPGAGSSNYTSGLEPVPHGVVVTAYPDTEPGGSTALMVIEQRIARLPEGGPSKTWVEWRFFNPGGTPVSGCDVYITVFFS